jgi:Sec-independent protein translocase protein TatA
VFDITPDKVVVVLVVALFVLGPSRLADFSRGVARARTELRRLTTALPPETRKAIRDPRGALIDALTGPRQLMEETAEACRQAGRAVIEEPGATQRGPRSQPGW